jgi:hypothetical protein
MWRRANRLLELSTPAAAASFVVVAATGVLMFLHVSQSQVENLHEWAGLAMVAAAGLHIARNWKALLGYRRRGIALQVSLAVAALGASVFLAAGFLGVERGGLDALRVRIEHAPLAELAPIFDESSEALVTRLQAAGLVDVTPQASPAQIAAASRASERAVLEALIVDSTARRAP